MRGMADKAWARGFNVVRLNQRNCGGTEHLSRGLYHSGLTADPLEVMRILAGDDGLPRFAFAGYSLGGNIALKLAGELAGDDRRRVVAVAAVSPPIELGVCVDALERRQNVAYHWNFLRGLRGRMRRKARLVSRRVGYRAAARASARCGPSTTPTRRRTTASPGRPTTTTAPAPVASSIAWPSRRCSSPPMTTRSCRRRRPATRRWPT